MITLLITALQLLITINATPNLPQSFRDQAVSIANYAIQVAQADIAQNQVTSVPVSVPSAPVPVPPAVTAPITQITPNIMPSTVSPVLGAVQIPRKLTVEREDTFDSGTRRYYDIGVFYTENDQFMNTKQVTLTADDNGTLNSQHGPVTVKTNTYATDGHPMGYFSYVPEAPGIRTLTATADGMTATLQVNGQY